MNSGKKLVYQRKNKKTIKKPARPVSVNAAHDDTYQLFSTFGNQVIQGFFKALPFTSGHYTKSNSTEVTQNPVIQQKSRQTEQPTVNQLMAPRFGTDVNAVQMQSLPGRTGLPISLKSGIEKLSGIRLDNVRVHYNSRVPSQLNAYAHTQGTDIHVAPGQERYLAHEAWHVVQQAQGRVRPTTSIAGMPVNDNPVLEHEADIMGARALSASKIQGITQMKESTVVHGNARHKAVASNTIQLMREDAIVTADRGAPLHKFKTKPNGSIEVLKRRFLFNIIETIPKSGQLVVDYDVRAADHDYIKAFYKGNEGYVNIANINPGTRISETMVAWQPLRPAGNWVIYDEAENNFLSQDLKGIEVTQIQSVLHSLETFENATHITIDKKTDIVKSLLEIRNQQVASGPAMTRNATAEEKQEKISNLTNSWLTLGIPKLQSIILERIKNDMPRLINANLIKASHSIKGIKFSGSDFHKGGQQVVFLRFEDNLHPEDTKIIVYKPSSLELDRHVLGQKLTDTDHSSAAEMLDETGGSIGNYKLLPLSDVSGHYGYMEFIKEVLPTTDTDVLGIYGSVAANMVLSYLIGLDDIHYDNIIICKNHIQLIDMEAATGRFTMPASPLRPEKAWADQLWGKAIGTTKLTTGIASKLKKQILAKRLKKLPVDSEIKDVMLEKFNAILNKAVNPPDPQQWSDLKQDLSHTMTRIVPIQTAAFYGFIDIFRSQPGLTQSEWNNMVDNDPTIVGRAKEGQANSTDTSLKNILKSNGTFNALKRGDIPFYMRDLGGTDVYDEENNRIAAVGHIKVSLHGIHDEIETRRQPQDRTDLRKLFQVQVIDRMIIQLNNDLREFL